MVCPICNSRTSRVTGVEFPTGGPRLIEWLESLGMPDFNAQHGRGHFYVCFEHFDRDDWIVKHNKIIGVRAGAVPSKQGTSRLRIERQIENNPLPEYIIVERKNLEKLFNYCHYCGHAIGKTLDYKITGTNIVYHWYCHLCGNEKGSTKYWSAQRLFSEKSGRRQSSGNLRIVAASLLSPLAYDVGHIFEEIKKFG